MDTDLARQIAETYQKHDWTLRRILLRSAVAQDREQLAMKFPTTPVVNAEIDALWFARPSHGGREAWELRLISEQAYALFEAFEADEGEEARDEARREMENKMREYVIR